MLGSGKREAAAGTLEEFKARLPYFELAPFFTSWEAFREMRSTTAGCSPVWRSARRGGSRTWSRADRRGEFTTLPLVVEGNRLLLNGQTDSWREHPRGSAGRRGQCVSGAWVWMTVFHSRETGQHTK